MIDREMEGGLLTTYTFDRVSNVRGPSWGTLWTERPNLPHLLSVNDCLASEQVEYTTARMLSCGDVSMEADSPTLRSG